MADATTADDILANIQNEAKEHNKALIESIDHQTGLMYEIESRQDQQDKYAAKQQGQEIVYSKMTQMHTDKLKGKAGEEIAQEEGQEESNDKLGQLLLTAKESLKETLIKKKQDLDTFLEEKAGFDNLSGALKADVNLITGQLQLLTQLPGIQTLLTTIKMIAAGIAMFFMNHFPKLFEPIIKLVNFFLRIMGKDEWKPDLKGRREATFEETEKGKDIRARMESAAGEGLGDATSGEKSSTYDALSEEWDREKAAFEEAGKARVGFWTDTKEAFAKSWTWMKTTAGELKENITNWFGQDHADSIKEALGAAWVNMMDFKDKVQESIEGMLTTVKENPMFTKDYWVGIGGKMKIAAKRMWTGTMKFLSKLWFVIRHPIKSLVIAAKAMWKHTVLFMKAVWGFLVQVALMTANLLLAIGGFIIANLPIILIIAAIVLLAVGLFFLIQYITDNWNLIKTKMSNAIDSLKLWGEQAWNWISDMGENLGYMIQWVLAKIQDGFAWAFNGMIDKANMIPGVNIEKFKGGNVEAIEAEREQVLAKRVERDKELEERQAALKDANEAKEKAAKEKDTRANNTVQQNNVSNTNKSERTTVGGTRPVDAFASAMSSPDF